MLALDADIRFEENSINEDDPRLQANFNPLGMIATTATKVFVGAAIKTSVGIVKSSAAAFEKDQVKSNEEYFKVKKLKESFDSIDPKILKSRLIAGNKFEVSNLTNHNQGIFGKKQKKQQVLDWLMISSIVIISEIPLLEDGVYWFPPNLLFSIKLTLLMKLLWTQENCLLKLNLKSFMSMMILMMNLNHSKLLNSSLLLNFLLIVNFFKECH